MIDNQGKVRCSKCGKLHSLNLEGTDFKLEWYCRDKKCHHFNREDSDENKKLDISDNSVVLLELR